MGFDFVMCARNLTDRKKKFGNEPGPTQFLFVPEDQNPAPDQARKRKVWAEALVEEAKIEGAPPGAAAGDILVYVHGYRNSLTEVMSQHRTLKRNLKAAGFRGAVVSFDWPSADATLGYIEDRADAKRTALQLVTDGVALFAMYQREGCPVNVHILAHSTGALVVREAFDDADDRKKIAAQGWMASQILLIAGDISSQSLASGNPSSESLYLHCLRLTNYSNPFDEALAISNVKRLGVAPRVGRVGLPKEAPEKAVNVDCGAYWNSLSPEAKAADPWVHGWHISDPVFTKDLLATLRGTDEKTMPTRAPTQDGQWTLVKPL